MAMGLDPLGGRSGALIRTYADTPNHAPLMSAYGTSTRAIWASMDQPQVTDLGDTTANRFFATRVRARIAAKRWKRFALVYFVGCKLDYHGPFSGALASPKGTFRASIEWANGSQQNAFNSTNAGGTITRVTFRGVRDATRFGGIFIVSDWITPPAQTAPFNEFPNRTLFPWVRTAWSKANAGDVYPAVNGVTYNYPENAQTALCSTYAAACSLIDLSGVSNYGAADSWGPVDSDYVPTCLGVIGEGLDGQMALLGFGTSIPAGETDASAVPPGVNPGQILPAYYDHVGYLSRFAQALDSQVPTLALAVGGSALGNVFSDGTSSDWVANPTQLAVQRSFYSQLARWFDVVLINDVNNDPPGDYPAIVSRFCQEIRRGNPYARIYGQKVPNGGLFYDGNSSPYTTYLDSLWAVQEAAVASGEMDGILNLRQGGPTFPVLPDVAVSTIASVAGNTITVNGLDAFAQSLVGSYVTVQGRGSDVLTANDGNAVTTNGLFTPQVGDPITIKGNTSRDLLHFNAQGARWAAGRLKTEIQRVEPNFPFFSRSS